MSSRNNPAHNKYLHLPPGIDPGIQQMQAQAAMQQRAAQEKVEAVLVHTASRIYAGLVVSAWNTDREEACGPGLTPMDYRELAKIARDAVPYFGEAMGYLRSTTPNDINEQPESDPEADVL